LGSLELWAVFRYLHPTPESKRCQLQR
jgi:hypothetical protein